MSEDDIPFTAEPYEPDSQTQQQSIDESIIEKPKMTICSEVNTVLTKEALKQCLQSRRQGKLRIERLKWDIQECDSKIKTVTKQLRIAQPELQNLRQGYYESRETKLHAVKSFMGFDETITALEDSVCTELSGKAKIFAERERRLSENVQRLMNKRDQHIEAKKLAGKLETEINKLLGKPEPTINEHLVEELESVEKVVEEKQAALNVKRLEKATAEDYISKRLALFEAIEIKRNENRQLQEKLEKKKANFNEIKQKLTEQVETSKDRLAKATEKEKSLSEQIQIDKQANEEFDGKNKELVELIAEKEPKLENILQQNKDRQNAAEANKIELNLEKGKLESINKEIEEFQNKKEALLRENSQNALILLNYKDKKDNLMAELLKEKTEVAFQQFQFEQERDQLQKTSETAETLIELLKAELKTDNEALEEEKRNQTQLSIDFEQLRSETELKHKENMDKLMKVIRTQTAENEIAQTVLEKNSKELEILKQKIKDEKDADNVDKLKLNKKNKIAASLERKIERQQTSYKKYEAQLKKRKDEKIKASNMSASEELTLSGRSDNQSPPLVAEIPSVVVVEDEDEVEDRENGRKSPGILKTPLKKPNPSPNRRVTFDVTSSESSVGNVSLDQNKQKSRNNNSEKKTHKRQRLR